jgi:O-antigen ligase
VAAAVLGLILLAATVPLVGLFPKVWTDRMATIVTNSPDQLEDSYDNGSKQAREELLHQSLGYITTHPIFGIGPGNFPAVSGKWRVAHNTYTELGAEAGLPALFLFLLVLGMAFRNLGRVSKSKAFQQDISIQVFTGALWASFGAYLLGAAFSDTQYELFPYFMVAYTTALYHLACVFPSNEQLENAGANASKQKFSRFYERYRKAELAGTR